MNGVVLRRSSEERNRRETAATELKIWIGVVRGNVGRVLHNATAYGVRSRHRAYVRAQ